MLVLQHRCLVAWACSQDEFGATLLWGQNTTALVCGIALAFLRIPCAEKTLLLASSSGYRWIGRCARVCGDIASPLLLSMRTALSSVCCPVLCAGFGARELFHSCMIEFPKPWRLLPDVSLASSYLASTSLSFSLCAPWRSCKPTNSSRQRRKNRSAPSFRT